MPNKTDIRRNTLTEAMLAPHLRDRLKRGGNGIGQNIASSSSRRSFLAGSDVSKNSLLYLADNGQLLKVENSTTANYKPVFAVAFASTTANNYVNIYNEGETIIIPNASFEIGKKIYLSADGLPTTDYAYFAGNLYQRLGVAISENSFVLNIESAKKMT